MAKRGSIHPRLNPSTPAAPSLRVGFTLIELILVMMIIAITAALIIPSLRAFTVARTTENAGTLILSLAQYARTASASEGRNYRLNFDTQNRKVWLTTLDHTSGDYVAPSNDYAEQFALATGLKLNVEVSSQPNVMMTTPTDVQQVTEVPTPPFGQPIAQANSIVDDQHNGGGTYIQIAPSGRSDPAHITITDTLGKEIDLGNATATEPLHLLTKEELQ